MINIGSNFSRFRTVQTSFTTLPVWGKQILLIFALPGLLLLGLSILLMLVSILALLLLTVPIYRLLLAVGGSRRTTTVQNIDPLQQFLQGTMGNEAFAPDAFVQGEVFQGEVVSDPGETGRRQVDAKIVE